MPTRPACQADKGTQIPQHQDLARIAQDALDRLRYLCASQWANPENKAAHNPAASALRQHFGQRSARVRKDLQARAKAMTDAAIRPHLFGRYAQQNPDQFLENHGKSQENNRPGTPRKRLGVPTGGRVNGRKIQEVWDIHEQELDTDPQRPELAYLSFRIDKIRCIDETNPEWWGQDQIAIAGLAVHASGVQSPIMPRSIGQGFDDGDEENFRPALSCHAFDLRTHPWNGAQKFLVSLVLAEQDRGELHSILDSAWSEITTDVQSTLESEFGPALGAYARPWISGLVSTATAWVLSEFFRWLSSAFNDDIFAPAYCWMTMEHPNARFTQYGTWGSPRSSRKSAHFFGYGGHYTMDYHWTLHN